MRINLDEEGLDPSKKADDSTRGGRARAHAAARLKARHAERDFLGRVMPTQAELAARDVSPAAAQRAAEGTTRLDAWLVSHGLAQSREKAKALIASGDVLVEGIKSPKPSTPVAEDAHVEIRPKG